jgi:hypothetical protein
MGDNNTSGNILEKAAEEEPPFPLTDIDRWVLSQTDEEFHLQTWEDLKSIIGKRSFFFLTCIGLVQET